MINDSSFIKKYSIHNLFGMNNRTDNNLPLRLTKNLSYTLILLHVATVHNAVIMMYVDSKKNQTKLFFAAELYNNSCNHLSNLLLIKNSNND